MVPGFSSVPSSHDLVGQLVLGTINTSYQKTRFAAFLPCELRPGRKRYIEEHAYGQKNVCCIRREVSGACNDRS